MTVAALTETRAQISGDGVTDRVDLPFQFVDQNDLKVIHTDSFGVDTEWNYQQSPGSWYFSGGNYTAGTVFFTPADLVAGERLTVTLISTFEQPFSLDGGEIDPVVLERSMDRSALSVQAIAARVNRSIVISASLEGELPEFVVPDLPDGYGIVRSGLGLAAVPISSAAITAAVVAAEAARTAAEAAETAAEAAQTAAEAASTTAVAAGVAAQAAQAAAEVAQAAAEAAAGSISGASSVSFDPSGLDVITANNVQAALAELDAAVALLLSGLAVDGSGNVTIDKTLTIAGN